jgi:homocysteine S-methyltransferase
VPGVEIPDEILARMRSAGDDPWRVGRAIALELVEGLRAEGVAGIYVMPQFGRYDLAADIVEAVRG